MFTPLVFVNYITTFIVLFVSLRVLQLRKLRSILAIMTLLFTVSHLVGVYWVPDEIRRYTNFDERIFNIMLLFHMIAALSLAGGCLVQHRFSTISTSVSNTLKLYFGLIFLISLLLTSVPVAVFMVAAFALLKFDSDRQVENVSQRQRILIERIFRSPVFAVSLGACAAVMFYYLVYLGGLINILGTLRYGFGSLADYLQQRVSSDFTPSFWRSQLDTIKASIAPSVSLLLISVFLYRRNWLSLVLLLAMVGLVTATKLESFAKSPLTIYGIQVVFTVTAVLAIGSKAGRRKTPAVVLVGFLLTGMIVTTMILFWMYSFSGYSYDPIDAMSQIGRRAFLVPSQSAYSWFQVFPDRMNFVGVSQNRILSFLSGTPYARLGYLPYQVSILSTGNMFGLNANFVASGWANYGAWGLIMTWQLVAGTLFVDRWLQAVTDPYVYWPVYVFTYGSLLIAVTVGFDGLVVAYGIWTVPVFFSVLAKLSAFRVQRFRLVRSLGPRRIHGPMVNGR